VKRRDLIRRLSAIARANGTTFELVREGGSHSIYRLGGQSIPIPRHAEIGEQLARSILRSAGQQ
jgi:mRNA interferase HicA